MGRKRKADQERELQKENFAREAQAMVIAKEKEKETQKAKKAKTNEKKSQEEQARSRLVVEKFVSISEPLFLKEKAASYLPAKPAVSFQMGNTLADPAMIFLKMVPKEAWDHIAEETERKMSLKSAFGEVSPKTAKKYHQEVTGSDILCVFVLRHLFRGRSDHRNLIMQFKDLPQALPYWPMQRERFTTITSALSCDFQVLGQILRDAWAKAIDPSQEFSVDEAMFAFQSKDLASPQRYIPRKPHPNGLLGYLACFKTLEGDPYVFDILADTVLNGKMNPRDAMQAFLNRFPWKYLTPHVTIDAGFSEEGLFRVILDEGWYFTSSVNIQHKKWLFSLLDSLCPLNSWLAVRDPSGIIWSIQKGGKDDRVNFLATNAFSPNSNLPEKVHNPVFTDQDAGFLFKLSRRGISAICRAVGFSYEDATTNISEGLINFLEQKEIEIWQEQMSDDSIVETDMLPLLPGSRETTSRLKHAFLP